MTRIEYGIARNADDWVVKAYTLTDAIRQARENGEDWRIVERSVTDWGEVE